MSLTGGAPVARVRDFPFQSYFDSTLLQAALLEQQPSIVSPRDEQIAGVAAFLHPSSQTPVSIDFIQAGGGPIILKPGQLIRPGRFGSFSWGLPFGWLGGGLAQLLIAQNMETDLGGSSQAEIIFHRLRIKVIASNAAAVVVTPNWPIRFPWPNALRGTSNTPQGGPAVIGMVTPTKILARLFNVPTLANTARVRLIFVNSDDFDRDATYAIPVAAIGNFPSIDIDWAPWAQSGITLANGVGTVENQLQELDIPTPLVRLGGDACCVLAVDVTPGGGNPLVNQFIDVVRYGLL
jgi:hypothetical protein